MPYVESKFNKENAMAILNSTANCHKQYCCELGLFQNYEDAVKRNGVIGGKSEAESTQHLLGRFLNSAARTQLAAYQPDTSLEQIQQELLSSLSEGKVFLIDIAAGHGAGTLSIINSICELRKEEVLPTDRLAIEIHAIDFNPESLKSYVDLVKSLSGHFNAHGISANILTHNIDLTKLDDSLKQEIEKIKRSIGKDPRYLLACSAISGVTKTIFQRDFKESYAYIIREFKEKNSIFFWTEPATKKNWMNKEWEELSVEHESRSLRFYWRDPHLEVEPIDSGANFFLLELAK